METYIITFLCVLFAEISCTIYIIAVEKKKALMASIFCSATILLTGEGIINFTDNHLNLIAAILGAFVGTFLTVKFKDVLEP